MRITGSIGASADAAPVAGAPRAPSVVADAAPAAGLAGVVGANPKPLDASVPAPPSDVNRLPPVAAPVPPRPLSSDVLAAAVAAGAAAAGAPREMGAAPLVPPPNEKAVRGPHNHAGQRAALRGYHAPVVSPVTAGAAAAAPAAKLNAGAALLAPVPLASAPNENAAVAPRKSSAARDLTRCPPQLAHTWCR
jgi:hypothetical protein